MPPATTAGCVRYSSTKPGKQEEKTSGAPTCSPPRFQTHERRLSEKTPARLVGSVGLQSYFFFATMLTGRSYRGFGGVFLTSIPPPRIVCEDRHRHVAEREAFGVVREEGTKQKLLQRSPTAPKSRQRNAIKAGEAGGGVDLGTICRISDLVFHADLDESGRR